MKHLLKEVKFELGPELGRMRWVKDTRGIRRNGLFRSGEGESLTAMRVSVGKQRKIRYLGTRLWTALEAGVGEWVNYLHAMGGEGGVESLRIPPSPLARG